MSSLRPSIPAIFMNYKIRKSTIWFVNKSEINQIPSLPVTKIVYNFHLISPLFFQDGKIISQGRGEYMRRNHEISRTWVFGFPCPQRSSDIKKHGRAIDVRKLLRVLSLLTLIIPMSWRKCDGIVLVCKWSGQLLISWNSGSPCNHWLVLSNFKRKSYRSLVHGRTMSFKAQEDQFTLVIWISVIGNKYFHSYSIVRLLSNKEYLVLFQ